MTEGFTLLLDFPELDRMTFEALDQVPWVAIGAVTSIGLLVLFLAVDVLPWARQKLRRRRSPDLSAKWAWYSDEDGSALEIRPDKGTAETALVPPNETLELGIVIDADEKCTPKATQLTSTGDFEIRKTHLYYRNTVSPARGVTDRDGHFKIIGEVETLDPDVGVNSWTIDVEIDPMEAGERREIPIHIATVEFGEPFETSLWLQARSEEED